MREKHRTQILVAITAGLFCLWTGGCNQEVSKDPIEQAQEAGERVEEALSTGQAALGEAEDALEGVEAELNRVREEKAKLQKALIAEQLAKEQLEQTLAYEREARTELEKQLRQMKTQLEGATKTLDGKPSASHDSVKPDEPDIN